MSPNILLGCHASWAEYDGVARFMALTAPRLPIIFGEVANKQDDTDDNGNLLGYYDLNGTGQNAAPDSGFTYQSFLPLLSQRGYGWLAWSWGPDNCAPRMMTTDGTSFASLTGPWESAERALGYGAAVLEGGLGFLRFFWDRNRMRAQDRLAETIVVHLRAGA